MIDKQMQQFIDRLDPENEQHAEVASLLKGHHQSPDRDLSQEYMDSRSQDIVEAYERTFRALVGHYRSYSSSPVIGNDPFTDEPIEIPLITVSLEAYLEKRLGSLSVAMSRFSSQTGKLDQSRITSTQAALTRDFSDELSADAIDKLMTPLEALVKPTTTVDEAIGFSKLAEVVEKAADLSEETKRSGPEI